MDLNKEISEYLNNYNCSIIFNAPMKEHTSFKMGGNADILINPKDDEAVKAILTFAKENDTPLTVVGNSSNLLISDDGIRGIVLKTAGGLCDISLSGNIITAGAGVSLAKLCLFALDNSLSGLEFAYGIPGTVGGAIYMNAGAYGGEIKDVLKSVTHINPRLEHEKKSAQELSLSYRHSFYSDNDGYFILNAQFELKKDDSKFIKERMDDFLLRRKSKQPLEYPSAGSTFKRPEGYFAGKLIEDCGLKGYRVGGAMVSEKHAGFVINYDNATTGDILNLISYIQKTVKEKTGVTLETEVKILR